MNFTLETWTNKEGAPCAKIRMSETVEGEEINRRAQGIPYSLKDDEDYIAAVKVAMEMEYENEIEATEIEVSQLP